MKMDNRRHGIKLLALCLSLSAVFLLGHGCGGGSGGSDSAPTPAAPANLSTTVVSSSQIHLAWTDQSNNEDGFRVYRGTDSSTVATLVATLGAGTTIHLDTGLAASTTHYYKVTAFNTVGESAASNVANATTDSPPVTIPAPPTFLQATATSSSVIRLTWTDQSGNETDFQIERKTGAGGTYAQIGTAAANATTYRDSGLAEGATYFYRVRAVNSVGNSVYSNESSATMLSSSSKSVVITGTVPGTVAIAYDYATGLEAARNVAGGTPKTFSLNIAPGEYYLMFITNEGTPSQRSFAFQNVTGGNVFTIKANTTLDLGALVFYIYPAAAKPLVDPISGNDNVTETFVREAIFSPGPGEWIATRKFVNSSCPGHTPGTTITEDVTIAQGFGIVTFTPAGTTGTAIGVANVNTAILTASASALETIYLTMQSDGSLAGTYSKAGYGGECFEDATITAVLSTSPPPAATLTGLSINGPSSMPEYGSPTYTATASWSDNPKSTVTPIWSVSSQVAEISTGGMLYCPGGVYPDQTVTVSATYSSGGITKTATMDVTIIHVWSIPFTLQELSGKAFLEVNSNAEGGYVSRLYKLNADFSLELTSYKNIPDTSGYETGTWSNDPYGIHLNISGREPFTVQRVAESSTGITMLIYDGPGPPSVVIWNEI